jgi:hypothetical protein
VADCGEATIEAFAVKEALEEPAGTETDAGTATALLLLERLTEKPPLAAPAVRVTVQLSVPAPVSELAAQLKPFIAAAGVPASLKV